MPSGRERREGFHIGCQKAWLKVMGKMICRCSDIRASVESCLHRAAPGLLSISREPSWPKQRLDATLTAFEI